MRAVLEFRYRGINARRAELWQLAGDRGVSGDLREAVLVIVRPLVESIDAGEMFVPFLAQGQRQPPRVRRIPATPSRPTAPRACSGRWCPA